MATARFLVEEIFDLPRRNITLAVGLVLDGVVRQGMTLQVEGSAAKITVAGIELIAPPPDRPNQATLIITRSSPTRPARGMVLIEA